MIIKKMNAPTFLDEAEYLTEWHHETDSGATQIWIQMSSQGKPEWIRLGNLYERTILKHENHFNEINCICRHRCCSIQVPIEDLLDLYEFNYYPTNQ